MRVGPSMWDPPSYEGLLYSCCIGVVNLTFSYIYCPSWWCMFDKRTFLGGVFCVLVEKCFKCEMSLKVYESVFCLLIF
jgi:hypothetical protein